MDRESIPGGIVSDDFNPNQKPNDFFAPLDHSKQPKPPGSFTQAFMGGAAETQDSELQDSPPQRAEEPAPSTPQLGATPESDIGSGPSEISPVSGIFTGMFGSAPVSPEAEASPGERTRVFETRHSNTSTRPEPPRLEQQGPVPSAPIPAERVSSDRERTPSRDFFTSNQGAFSAPVREPQLNPQGGKSGFTELFGKEPLATPPIPPNPKRSADFTQAISGGTPISPRADAEKTPSSELSRWNEPLVPSSSEVFSPSAPPIKRQGLTELSVREEPLAAGSAMPAKAAGEFTRMMSGGAQINTPADSADKTPSGEFFRVNPPPLPSSQGVQPAAAAGKPQGFTEFFGIQQPPQPGKATPANVPGEFTRMMSGGTQISKPADSEKTPSGEFFRLNPPQVAPPAQGFSPIQAGKPQGLTDLFGKEPSRSAPAATPAAPGEFTRMMSAGTHTGTPADAEKTPSAEFFRMNPPPVTPSVQGFPPAAPANKQPGLTELFGGQQPLSPSATPAKPQGEFTRVISGNDPALRGPSPALSGDNAGGPGRAAATRLFSASDAAAAPPISSGPSEYTRVVSASQLRDLQQGAPSAAPGVPGTGNAGGASAMASNLAFPKVPTAPPAMPSPQSPVPAAPYAMPQWQPPPPPQMQPPQVAWQSPQMPSAPPIPTQQPQVPQGESKIMKYLPLIIGLNALFLIALLLIVIFALKK